jgi:general bacterial porin, GBP family
MKLRSLGIAAAMLVAGAAHAQSSVTLYGLIDTGIEYASGQKSPSGAGAGNWQMSSAAMNTPRWGLRGTEDLGNGLSAIFWLEDGFNSANGTIRNGGTFFGRQAAVGIQSKQYGALTLGRQYDFIVTYLQPFSAVNAALGGGNMATHVFDNDNTDNDMRINNSVKFSSASFGGLKVGAMYAFSGQAGGFSNNSAYSGGASYSYGPFNVAAAYLQINRSTNIANATGAASTGDADALTLGGRQQIFGVGGQYMLGQSSIGLLWTHSVTDNVSAIMTGGSVLNATSSIPGGSASYLKFDNFEVNGIFYVRPDVRLIGQYVYTMGQLGATNGTKTKPHWNQVMGAADYLLSKRTDVYLAATYQTAGGTNGMSVFNADVGTLSPSATTSQVVVATGIRHRF